MAFNSLTYFILLACTLVAFFGLPRVLRIPLLILASVVFYAFWSLPFVGLIILSATIDYAMGIGIARYDDQPRLRRACLTLSIVSNLAILGYFKYSNFFLDNIATALGSGSYDVLHVILPPGISFYTFQSMSYTIDVYRRDIKPTYSFQRFFLFVSFFPQLVAGPIERAGHLLTQFDRAARQRISPENLVVGGRMIVWGLFKKVMIADYCGLLVDRFYENPQAYDGTAGLLATYLFGIQIYCDFSAYSEIARGSARLFGIDLMKNFDQPLLSESMMAFWRRWHISLGTWIRDYLYRPLGGNQVGPPRALFNLFIVAALSGLWHGAAWNFVLWGLYHGALMVVIVLIQRTPIYRHLAGQLGHLRLFSGWFLQFHLSNIGFVMFRATSAEDIGYTLRAIWSALEKGLPMTPIQAAGFLAVGGFLLLSALERRYAFLRRIDALPALSILFYGILIAAMLLFGYTGERPFIYFQF